MVKLSDMYKNARDKAKGKLEGIKEEVDEKGGERVAKELYRKGRNTTLKAAYEITKAATSTTVKVGAKTGVGIVGGAKLAIGAKVGKWLEQNYDTVINNMDMAGLGEREKRAAKAGVVIASITGKIKDGIVGKVNKAKDEMEEKVKQYTLESAVPELFVAVGLIDKFSKEEGTLEDRTYKMDDGAVYKINKNPKTFEINTTHPDKRNLTIKYNITKNTDLDTLVEDTQFLLNDLTLRVEEYSDPTLKSFGETTRDVAVNSKRPGRLMGESVKVYTSKFSKEKGKLQFEYTIKRGTLEKECSNVYFAGKGIDVKEETK